MPPALAAWLAAALALCTAGAWALAGAAACVVLSGGLLAVLKWAAPSGRWRALCTGACLVLLSAAAGAGVGTAHAADLHRGPVPRLARQQSEAAVELTVTDDPRRIRPSVRGARQSSGAVLFRADVTRVRGRTYGSWAAPRTANGPPARASCAVRAGPSAVPAAHRGPLTGTADVRRPPAHLASHAGRTPDIARSCSGAGPPAPATGRAPLSAASTSPTAVGQTVRTPVLVIVERRHGPPTADWLRLLPSTGLRLHGRLGPSTRSGPARDVAAVLHARVGGRPQTVRPPSALQRAAGSLRAGLRRATDGLGADARGLLPGLVVGDTSRLPADLDASFRSTDMTHLLAVSGANLTILLTVLIGPASLAQGVGRRGLAGRLGVSLRGTAVLGALTTLGFVVVCRPDPSVLRAAACGLIAVLALATGRRRSLLPALAAAVLALVLYDPWLALDFGFLLSVLATGALLTVAPRWSAALRRRRVPARLAEALAAAAAAQVVCAPVVVVLAAHVSLVAVPCNLLAEFAVAPATVLGFGALAAAPVATPLAETLAWLAAWPTRCIAAIARTGAALPGAEIGWPGSGLGSLLLALCTAALLLAAARLRLWHRPWLCAACVLLLLVAVLRPAPLVRPFTGWPPPHWRMVACDIGQGDALVLATGRAHTAVVVDTGPEPRAVDRCLRTLGVTSIPLLVLTHFHADHVRGLPGALRGRTVGAVQTTALQQPPGQAEFVRRTAKEAGVRTIGAVPGERRHTGELSWRVLWPPAPVPGVSEQPENPNDASITLLVHTAGLSLLLPGDLEPEAQQQLLTDMPGLPRVDVLKVAHHGSAYQSPELLHRLHPRIALISAGADNPYGHPSPRTLAAVREEGAAVGRTDRNGALAVTGGAPGDEKDARKDARSSAARPSLVRERGTPPGAGPVAATRTGGTGATGAGAPTRTATATPVFGRRHTTRTADAGRTPTSAYAAARFRGRSHSVRRIRDGRRDAVPRPDLSRAPATLRSRPRGRRGWRACSGTAQAPRTPRSPPATARPPRRPRRPELRGPPAVVRPSRRGGRSVPRPAPPLRRVRAAPG